MTEAFRCPYCGAASSPQAQFCSVCGRSLASAPMTAAPAASAPVTASTGGYGAQLSAGGPPSIFGAAKPQAPVVVPGAAKPLGILLLAVFVAGTSVVGLLILWDYAYWANWRFSNDDFFWGAVDAVFGLGYLITSIYGFTITSKLWSLQPYAWSTANLLCGGWLALDLLGFVLFGATALSLVGFFVIVGMLAYLNSTPVRALFGREPLVTFGATAGRTPN